MSRTANGPLGVDKLFVYGILKRNFCLDLERYGQRFIGPAMLHSAKLYALGSGVGLRRTQDVDDIAYGELFQIVDSSKWYWLDGIEGNGCNYTREIVKVSVPQEDHSEAKVYEAWVYVHTYYRGDMYGREIKAIKGGLYSGRYPQDVEA